MESPPKPNTQALSWFYGEFKKEALSLKPKYQRNPIWSIGQKCFLIDSLISGCPLPQVYINVITKRLGKNRSTVYEVVDGQQRLRTIIEFMNGEWKLLSTTAKSYPVSKKYKHHIGKYYSQLPSDLQDQIWNYPLAVQELRGWTDRQIRSLFRRLNYVVEKLNRQELRHSQYFGEFVKVVEQLTQLEFWDNIGLFSRRDSQRMKDVEFISELYIVIVDGLQDQQKTIDKFYADYDVVYPKKSKHLSNFNQVIESLRSIEDVIVETRFSKKADFYALFAAVKELNLNSDHRVDLSFAAKSLRQLSTQLEKPPETLTGTPAKYSTTVIEGPNKLQKRKQRTQILLEILS